MNQLFFKKESYYKQIFDELFEYSTDFVWKMLKNKDETEDIVQQSFIKLFKNLNKFKSESSLKTYFTRILINTSMDYFKRKKPIFVDINQLENVSEHHSQDSLDFDHHLARLSGQQRICLSLFYYDSLSIKEIADLSGQTEGTIKSHLSRGRQQLKQYMEQGNG